MARERATALWRDGKPAEALAEAWAAAAAGGTRDKVLVASLLKEEPQLLAADHADDLRRLLVDRDIDPGAISGAGWAYLIRDAEIFAGEPAAVADRVERDPLALTLLREDIVANSEAERALAAVRRHLLFADSQSAWPQLRAALIAQAALNGGAWPFDDDERSRLDRAGEFVLAYLPSRPHAGRAADFADPVTRAVAEQYEAWPYPTWTRVMARDPGTLADSVRAMDPDGPATISTPADILIAGCGSGSQVALSVMRMPRERFTAIDLSHASVAEASARCAARGVTGVDYHVLDLHCVAELGKTFDAVFCTGVLHHLPDPEAGWAALAAVLKPGGVMRIMLYSKVARMRIVALRRMLADLIERPVTDALLRQVRQRILAAPPHIRLTSRDFFSLAGVHDLLLHRHEDPFDLPRIRRALDTLGLTLLRYDLPNQRARRKHRERFAQDTLRRDFEAWAAMERDDPMLFAGMYDFWCRKPR